MVDFKKEIKLSDLRPKPKRKAGAATAVKTTASKSRKGKKQEIVGLKIGSSQLAAARVVNNGSAKLVQLAREPLAPGIVVGGEVRDIAALGTALDTFFTEHKLPRKGVRIGIGTNRVGVRALDIEGIDDPRQLGNAVRFRAHEALSIPMDEAVLDYHVVSEKANEEGGVTRRVVLAAAYREPVDHFVAACRAGGLELMGIDVEAFAMLRAVAPKVGPNGAEPTAIVAVSLGHDRSTLAISNGNGLRLHARPRVGRREARNCDRPRSGPDRRRSRRVEARGLAARGRCRRGDGSTRDPGPHERAAGTDGACARARRLAAVLPEPARLPSDRRDPPHGRHDSPARARRGAGTPRERAGARRRSAGPAVEAAGAIAHRDDLGSLAVAIGLGVER